MGSVPAVPRSEWRKGGPVAPCRLATMSTRQGRRGRAWSRCQRAQTGGTREMLTPQAKCIAADRHGQHRRDQYRAQGPTGLAVRVTGDRCTGEESAHRKRRVKTAEASGTFLLYQYRWRHRCMAHLRCVVHILLGYHTTSQWHSQGCPCSGASGARAFGS